MNLLLSEEEICKAAACAVACGIIPGATCKFQDKRGCLIYQAGRLAAQAQLSHLQELAGDECLRESIEQCLRSSGIQELVRLHLNHHYSEFSDEHVQSEIDKFTEGIYSLFSPLLAARVSQERERARDDEQRKFLGGKTLRELEQSKANQASDIPEKNITLKEQK
jgi:hypothetical protein